MTTLQIIREAMIAGAEAYKNGISIYDCPHEPMTDNLSVISWERGWRDAQANRSEFLGHDSEGLARYRLSFEL